METGTASSAPRAEGRRSDLSSTRFGSCQACAQQVVVLLDFGPQPLCNRLLARRADHETTHPLRLGQCLGCGLLQLIERVAVAELKPAKVLRYTEPEGHLDQVADMISQLPGIDGLSPILGITAKDASTIKRLASRGFRHATCLDIRQHLGMEDPTAGVETIQQWISDGTLRGQAAHCGRYQVVIARHILEHAHQLRGFVDELSGLLLPGGYLVLEVPDFAGSLLAGNYSALWEEHVVYFTPVTLPLVLEHLGLDVRHVRSYPCALEDSLVAVVTPGPQGAEPQVPDGAAQHVARDRELALGRRFAAALPHVRQHWREHLARELVGGRQVALLGAGHSGIQFLNLLDLADVVQLVVDDDPEKQGVYLPGSRRQVCKFAAVLCHPVRLCLLSVSPEGEDRVLLRHHEFADCGGRFASIFPSSRLAYVAGLPASVEPIG
jgi:hypothetical protein